MIKVRKSNDSAIPIDLSDHCRGVHLYIPTVACHLPLYSGDIGFSIQSRRFSYGNEM